MFKNLGKEEINASKELAKNLLKSPGRALENGANVSTAFASQSLKAASSSLPEVIKLYLTGKELYLGKYVRFF